MFISTAWAQGGVGGGGGDIFSAILPLVLIFAVFYFLLIRPQQKKMKQHREMLSAVRRGDKIVTGGGIHGTVTKVVDDSEIVVEIADGVRIRVVRDTVSAVLTKPAPVTADSAKPANEGGEKKSFFGFKR